MKPEESNTARLWLSPEEIAARLQQQMADEYQRDAIASTPEPSNVDAAGTYQGEAE